MFTCLALATAGRGGVVGVCAAETRARASSALDLAVLKLHCEEDMVAVKLTTYVLLSHRQT